MLVPMKSTSADPFRRRSPGASALVLAGLVLLALGTLAPRAALAADPPAGPPAATEAARKNAIKGLKRKIRKLARSPWVHKKTPDILKSLEALAALRGYEAGEAALEASPCLDEGVRKAAFDIVEREHHKKLVKPLAALLESKDFRRDADIRRRIAHALAVMADPAAIEPLTALIRFDEDAEVVAEAADALSGYGAAPIDLRRESVRRLVDVYETTYNYKESIRPEDKILRKLAQERYKVYAKSVRAALQSLTGVQLTRPHDWRRWWNTNKKKRKWGRETDPGTGSAPR
jgi:HEAT repeat protein